jgi:hypothetical protein
MDESEIHFKFGCFQDPASCLGSVTFLPPYTSQAANAFYSNVLNYGSIVQYWQVVLMDHSPLHEPIKGKMRTCTQ